MHPLRQTWAGLGLDAKSLTVHSKIPSGLELKQAEFEDSVMAFAKPMNYLLQGILGAKSSFTDCSLRHVNRAFIGAAHELAQYAKWNNVSHGCI